MADPSFIILIHLALSSDDHCPGGKSGSSQPDAHLDRPNNHHSPQGKPTVSQPEEQSLDSVIAHLRPLFEKQEKGKWFSPLTLTGVSRDLFKMLKVRAELEENFVDGFDKDRDWSAFKWVFSSLTEV